MYTSRAQHTKVFRIDIPRVVTYLGTLALAASFAEMASIRPVAGAQYYWFVYV